MTTSRLSRLVLSLCLATVAAAAAASETAQWMRYPAISPDGSRIVFSFRGDLWTVPAEGGRATPLTLHDAYDFAPVWSPDGQSIAFASDRYGNDDVFLIPAAGGAATRLTFHSADDRPSGFTPDGSAVLLSSGRLDAASNVQYPRGGSQPELYAVPVAGGMPTQVLTTPALDAVWSRDGELLAYTDLKGLEDEWRKHDDSSFARDVWLYEASNGSHRRLTGFGVDDRQPVWSPDQRSLYYLSERSGSFNVWRLDLADPSTPVQVTFHEVHPVRFLSVSDAGDLCYGFDGGLWVRPEGAAESRRVEVVAPADDRRNDVEWVDVARQVSEIAVSPDGGEIAFVARGEVFVTSADHSDTRRVTSTPEQERSVSFSPDGRSLLYASERDGSWNLYRTDLTDDAEPDFFNATAMVERPVLETDDETFQPRFSPDGKRVAYLLDRTGLAVLDLESGTSTTILSEDLNYSYADGDQWYEWSPDGRWFLVQYLSPTRWSAEVGLVASDGAGELRNLTRSGYEDQVPRWVHGGEAVMWLTDRHGYRAHSMLGSMDDVYVSFLTTEAWDRFRLSEAELEQVKAREKKADGDAEKGDGDAADDGITLPEPVELELDGLEDRTARLTLQSARLAGAALTPDGETLLVVARLEKAYDLYAITPRERKVERLAALGADSVGGLEVTPDGKHAYVLADHKVVKITVDGGKKDPVALEAEMALDPAAERAYLFEHVWRQTREKFLDPDMHGVDWDAMKAAYGRFLPSVATHRDFAELVSEMLGELNASHTGMGFRPRDRDGDATASLGLFPDPAHGGEGIRIQEVLEGGPLETDGSRIDAGVVVASIDGTAIGAGENWYPLLNRKAGEPVRLGLLDPESGETWEETVKPVSLREEAGLLYERWVRGRRAEVERLSGGRLGYAHVRSMNDASYREIFEDIFGRAVTAEGIVLDTRFNSGGNLVEPLTVLLDGVEYMQAVPRGRRIGSEPSLRWTRPSVVVMNEGNYSDAHCFPSAYTSLGLGETVGMQVPGTCTAVWWETLQDRELYFGIPQVGWLDMDGDIMENKHLDPVHEIDNDPALEAAGRDQQLEKAVEVLLRHIDDQAP